MKEKNRMEIFAVNDEYYNTKQQVVDRIFNADTGIDNKGLKRVYEEVLKQGNRELADNIHTAMYDNRATIRVKQAERIKSSLNESFDTYAFAEKIKSEGDIKEKENIVEKSTAFKDAPHFSVGMYQHNIDEPEVKEKYINRVKQIAQELDYQLNFAINRENHMNKTIEAAKELLGVDAFNNLYNGKTLDVSNSATIKTQEEVFNEIWSNNNVDNFQKKGEVQARKAIEGERIDTVINGEIETTNVAKKNDIVVKGVKNEEYIMSKDKFDNRYSGGEVGDVFSTFKAKGKTWAMEYVGKPIEFMASWGEKMILKTGDFLCNPEKDKPGDLYRIEKSAFNQTYEKVADFKNKFKTVKEFLTEPNNQEKINRNTMKP